MAVRLFEEVTHAQLYSKYRPTYPRAVLDIISSFISKHGGGFGTVVDVGCGSGQSTFYLGGLFQRCVGIDISKAQVENAQRQCQENVQNVEFKVGDVSNLPVESETVDVVTCAQAWHWLNPADLYRECNRVLKPKGCLVVYGYGNVELTNKDCNRLVSNFYSSTLKGCWHQGRLHIDNLYKDVKLPYKVTERHDLSMHHVMSLPGFIGYVSSWSGYQTYCERNPGNTMLTDLQEGIKAVLEGTDLDRDQEAKVEMRFPVFVIMGQKD